MSAESMMPVKRRLSFFLLLVILLSATFLAFLPVKEFGFVNYDDETYLTENPHVTSGSSWANVRWAFTSCRYLSNWHPLTWLSYFGIHQFFGLNPAAYHLANLFLHLLNTGLLFYLLWQMTGGVFRSFFVAALFALHPLHVESVVWIAELKDVLSTFFWLAASLAYVWYVRGPSVRRYVLTLVLFTVGLMAKPMVISLPFVFLLLDYWPLGRMKSKSITWGLVREKIPFFVLAITSGLITSYAQQAGGAIASFEKLPLTFRAANASVAYVKYLLKTVHPTDLTVFYPHPEKLIPMGQVAAALALLLVITGLVMRFSKRKLYLPVGWFWYLGTLIPVIGLVQVGSQQMADRYTYLPLIGVFLAVTWGAADLVGRWRIPRPLAGVLSGLLILACFNQTRTQVQYWRDSVTLFEHALRVTSKNYLAHVKLAHAFLKKGDLEKAKGHLHEALGIQPRLWNAYSDLGVILVKERKYEEAIENYQKALALKPDYFEAQVNLGIVYEKQCKIGLALEHYHAAEQLKPDAPEVRKPLTRLAPLPGKSPEEQEEICRFMQISDTLNQIREATPYDPLKMGKINRIAQITSDLRKLRT